MKINEDQFYTVYDMKCVDAEIVGVKPPGKDFHVDSIPTCYWQA